MSLAFNIGRLPQCYCKRKIPVIDFHFQEQISMTETRQVDHLIHNLRYLEMLTSAWVDSRDYS